MSGAKFLHENDAYMALLVDYAAGTLSYGQSVIVNTHLNYTPEARDYVQSCEHVAGAMIEKNCDPVAMAEDALDQVLGMIDGLDNPDPQGQNRRHDIFPEDLCALPDMLEACIFAAATHPLKWRSILPGITGMDMPFSCRQSTISIFRMAPKTSVPEHRHTGLEVTLVLDGDLNDETMRYSTGDLVVHEASADTHAPVASHQDGCTCIVGYDNPVRLTRFPANLLNLLMR